MKLLIIGQSVVDIIHFQLNQILKPGGIYYSSIALQKIMQAKDEIYLLSEKDEKSWYLFKNIYSQFKIDFITDVKSIPRVELFVNRDGTRKEIVKINTNELELDEIKDFKSFDGIFINMIMPTQLSIEQLEKLRSNYDGIIYCDLHSLCSYMNAEGVHVKRKIPSIERWLNCIDIIQANEREVHSIMSADNEELVAEFVFRYRPIGLIITKAERGVEAYLNKTSGIVHYSLEATKVKANNFVGCGDVFGSTFFYSYINKGNFYESIKKANLAAGLTSTFSNENDYNKLKEIFN